MKVYDSANKPTLINEGNVKGNNRIITSPRPEVQPAKQPVVQTPPEPSSKPSSKD